MDKHEYNPFSKKIKEIECDDLQVLTEVSEGWFIDYKSSSITIKDYAKHISAFSNQYGGLIFIGIKEDEKTRRAESFPGIPTSEISNVLLKIREAVSTHLQPTPDYEIKVLDGPNPKIGLAKGKSILVLSISRGLKPPYIHSSGKIYRRVDDESKPETDRYELDQLWARSEKLDKNFEAYLKDEPSYDNDNLPRLLIYFVSDPKNKIDGEDLSFLDFQNLLKEGGNNFLPCNNFHTSKDGFIARQLGTDDPNYDSLTLHWREFGDLLIEVPINHLSQHDSIEYLSKYPRGKEFAAQLYHKGFKRAEILDFTHCIAVLERSAFIFLKLREMANIKRMPYMKAKLSNVAGMSPFLNSESYMEEIDKWGIPIIKFDTIWEPRGFTCDSLYKLEMKLDDGGKTAHLGVALLKSIGIIRDLKNEKTIGEIYNTSLNVPK